MINIGLLVALLISAEPQTQVQPPFLTLRFVEPKLQGDAFLALFNGAKAPHPAAALAGYRQAHNGLSGLSKAAEAGLAALNPRMLGELSLLHNATVQFRRRPDGRLGWNAVILNDDGSFEAVGTAFALTDGLALPPIDGASVDRLGPPGAPLLARRGLKLVVAGTETDVSEGLTREESPLPSEIKTGVVARFDPNGLTSNQASLTIKRLAQAFSATGVKYVDASIRLENDGALAIIRGDLSKPFETKVAIQPSWLAFEPQTEPIAIFAFAIDSSPPAWDAFFNVIDQVERVDPARGNIAPARLRLSLLLGAAKVKPEIDLFPVLKGISGVINGNAKGEITYAVVRFHVTNPVAAAKLATETFPRLAAAARIAKAPSNFPGQFVVGNKVLAISSSETEVSLMWGEKTTNAAGGLTSVRPEPAKTTNDLQRFLIFWPQRIPSLGVPSNSPVVWMGRNTETETRDEIRWNGLSKMVKAVVDRLPIESPPDVSGAGVRK